MNSDCDIAFISEKRNLYLHFESFVKPNFEETCSGNFISYMNQVLPQSERVEDF